LYLCLLNKLWGLDPSETPVRSLRIESYVEIAQTIMQVLVTDAPVCYEVLFTRVLHKLVDLVLWRIF